jgi:hypothetical protein
MARSITVTLTSDKSGDEIPAGTGGRVRILFYEDGKVDMRADLTDAEIARLVKEYKLKPVQPRNEPRRRRLTL